MKRLLLRWLSPELAELADRVVQQAQQLDAARKRIQILQQTLDKSNDVNRQLVDRLEHAKTAYRMACDRASTAEAFLAIVAPVEGDG